MWDKIATDWAGKEEWMRERKVESTLADMYQFVTFALDRMKLSTVHRRKKSKGIGKKFQEKKPRDLGPADTTIHTRADGLTVQLCGGESNVTCKWINGEYSMGQKYRGRSALVQKGPTFMVQREECQSDFED